MFCLLEMNPCSVQDQKPGKRVAKPLDPEQFRADLKTIIEAGWCQPGLV